MSKEFKRLIAKAEHALEVAKELMNIGYPSDAASKVYYSMFYAAQAFLKKRKAFLTAIKNLIGVL